MRAQMRHRPQVTVVHVANTRPYRSLTGGGEARGARGRVSAACEGCGGAAERPAAARLAAPAGGRCFSAAVRGAVRALLPAAALTQLRLPVHQRDPELLGVKVADVDWGQG